MLLTEWYFINFFITILTKNIFAPKMISEMHINSLVKYVDISQYAEAGCYYKKKVPNFTLQIQKI